MTLEQLAVFCAAEGIDPSTVARMTIEYTIYDRGNGVMFIDPVTGENSTHTVVVVYDAGEMWRAETKDD